MKIPIIILNYNSSSDCKKCTSFLQKQKGVELEIMIVDNCSKEEDCKAAEELCRQNGFTFIVSKENRGYNAGNNIGLKYAAEKDYKYALIANPDMEFPQENYVIQLLRKMEEDPEIVACGSNIVGVDGKQQNPLTRDGHYKESLYWIRDVVHKYKKMEVSRCLDNPFESHYCKKISGCCLMLRMDFIKQIAFFDENIFLYCEEPILSKQVQQKRKKMFYLFEAKAVHAHIRSEKGDPIKRLKLWKKSRTYFINKYSGYSFWGKLVSKISISLYVIIYSVFVKVSKD